MKLSLALSVLVGFAAAAESGTRSFRRHSIAVESFDGELTVRAAGIPAGAPAGYSTSVHFVDRRSLTGTENLQALPANVQRRYESVQAMRRLRRLAASDFFECANANPAPSSNDCSAITKNVLATATDLVVAANSCLVFTYNTCAGFFCSLCETLTTSTDFIGSQLDTVDALCVSNNQAGTIVGDSAPQYQVGFIRNGASLPNYDVC